MCDQATYGPQVVIGAAPASTLIAGSLIVADLRGPGVGVRTEIAQHDERFLL